MGTVIIYGGMLIVALGIVLGFYLYARRANRRPPGHGRSTRLH